MFLCIRCLCRLGWRSNSRALPCFLLFIRGSKAAVQHTRKARFLGWFGTDLGGVLAVRGLVFFGACGGFGCSYVFGVCVGLAGGLIPVLCRASSCLIGVPKLQYSTPGKHVFWAGSAQI